MSIRYLCIGGFVRSSNDGDVHYVNSKRVMELYGVDPKECRLLSVNDSKRFFVNERYKDRYILLYPDPTGLYVVPKMNSGKFEREVNGQLSKLSS